MPAIYYFPVLLLGFMICYKDKQTNSIQGAPVAVVVTFQYFAEGQKESYSFDREFTVILLES